MDDSTLTQLICARLGTIPGWEWRASGPRYSAAVVGLFYGSIDSEPDRAVGARIYDGDDPYVDPRKRSLQLRFRGARGRRDGADILAFPAFVVLTGLSRETGISSIERLSFSTLGADGNQREQRTDNYQITLDNPEASS